MSSITLRTQPTCQHCLNEDHRAIHRFASLDGDRATCGGCGMDLGDAKELTIPHNVVSVYDTLIKRAAMRVRYFNRDLPVHGNGAEYALRPMTTNQIEFASRAARGDTVQCTLDWIAYEDSGCQLPVIRPVEVDLPQRLESFPPGVALAAQAFINDGFAVIECPRKGAKSGTIRFRKNQRVDITGSGVRISVGDRDLVNTQKERYEETLIRGRVTW